MLKGVGIRIKDLREERELTMDMLIQDINSRYELENPLNKGMVSRWERDINNPSLDSARCLCDYFNVSLDYSPKIMQVLYLRGFSEFLYYNVYFNRKKSLPTLLVTGSL